MDDALATDNKKATDILEVMERGEKKARIDIVKDLLKEGTTIDLILKTSKMSKKEIEELMVKAQ